MAERARLEIVWAAMSRGFESRSLRHPAVKMPKGHSFFIFLPRLLNGRPTYNGSQYLRLGAGPGNSRHAKPAVGICPPPSSQSVNKLDRRAAMCLTTTLPVALC